MRCYTILTPTGDRPEAINILKKYVKRQTLQPFEWIVVDDGKVPLKEAPDYKLIRREPKPSDSGHTLRANVLAGLNHVKTDYIIFMEDDDWYAPNHCETLVNALQDSPLVGHPQTYNYNLLVRKWRRFQNKVKACLCQTAIRSDYYKLVEQLCISKTDWSLDIDLWNQAVRSKTLPADPYTMIGMKGLPGRAGQTSGHLVQDGVWHEDYCFMKLKELIGSDISNYYNLTGEKEMIPSIIGGMRVHKLNDGSFVLPRCPPDLERELDKQYKRIDTIYRWFEPRDMRIQLGDIVSSLGSEHECYIVGKGPSLDSLTDYDFQNQKAPIFCINESVHKVESLGIPNPVFCVQQDVELGAACKPLFATLIVSEAAAVHYKDIEAKFIYNPLDLDSSASTISAVIAIRIAKLLGMLEFTLYGFDACTNKKTAYADCIGRSPGSNPERFINHCSKIKDALEGTVYWFKSIDPIGSSKASDTLPPSS